MTLVELGLLSPEELARHLEAKAEETVYSLFDWSDGVFRFEEGLPPRNNIFPVELEKYQGEQYRILAANKKRIRKS